MKCEKSGNHTISYQSLLLSTTVLNDTFSWKYVSSFEVIADHEDIWKAAINGLEVPCKRSEQAIHITNQP